MRRVTVSIGLWQGDENAVRPRAIPPAQLGVAVRATETNGVRSVLITPLRLMSVAHWDALDDVWSTAQSTSPAKAGG